MKDGTSRLPHRIQLISKLTNPCILSVILLLSIAYTKSVSVRIVAGSVTVVLIFLVLLPLVYVYMRAFRSKNGLGDPTTFLKKHPKDILILILLSGLPCLIVLILIEAPTSMIYALSSLLVVSVVITVFNLFYRASYHLASMTVLVIVAAIVWGKIFLILLVTIPIIGWAKYRNHEHTPTQLVMGITVSLIVTIATLHLLGRL